MEEVVQAAKSLANIYKNVIATDTSEKQLQFANKLPNVRYQQTPPTMSIAEVEQEVVPQGTLDLITIAQALHWFDFPNFYQQVKWLLKKPLPMPRRPLHARLRHLRRPRRQPRR